MAPVRYQRLMDCFDEACDLPPDQQRQRVTQLRREDPALADRLLELLAGDGQDAELLAPAAGAQLLARALGSSADEASGIEPAGAVAAEAESEDRGREGSQVGRWRVCERLGSGGVGTVYRVQADDGQVAAIKFLRASVCADPEAVKRLRREFQGPTRAAAARRSGAAIAPR